MPLEHVLNFLCYDLRPPLEQCIQKGQQSISTLRSFMSPLLKNCSNNPFSMRPSCQPTATPCALDPQEAEALHRQRLDMDLQEISQEIWQSANAGAGTKEWLEKSEFSKLLFYWMAVGGDVISEDPFENFKYFVDLQTQQKFDTERCLCMWYSMPKDQQMPFRFEACLARIAAGKINFYNEREIRDYMYTSD